jgi:hypothetical protein
VLADAVLTSGSYAGGDAVGYVVFTQRNNIQSPSTIADGDQLYAVGVIQTGLSRIGLVGSRVRVNLPGLSSSPTLSGNLVRVERTGPSPIAFANGTPVENGALSDSDDQTFIRAAIEAMRSYIQVVPGSGPIRGQHLYSVDSTVYAFRDNVGATQCDFYGSSADGWVLQDLGGTLQFTGGVTHAEIVVGDTINGVSSGASAIVTRVTLSSGSWANGNAAGTLYLRAISGTFTDGENIIVEGKRRPVAASYALRGEQVRMKVDIPPSREPAAKKVGLVGRNVRVALSRIVLPPIADGSETLTVLSPGGRYEMIEANFGGHTERKKIYGCDGVNKAFEYDGTAFIQITTGMPTDTPRHVAQHQNHLWLSFSGGSLQLSSLTDPHEWSVVTGAAELQIGEEITGLARTPGDLLMVSGRNKIMLLYGTPGVDLQMREHQDIAGAAEWSVQRFFDMIYLDDRGLTNLAQTQAYGDFEDNTFSQKVSRRVEGMVKNVTASVVSKLKNQYRLFFDDGTALYVTFDNRRIRGIMPVTLGKTVRNASHSEDSSGNARMFFGSDDGYVYELDSGTSFDGSVVDAFLQLHFNHFGTPQQLKKFTRLAPEAVVIPSSASRNLSIQMAPIFSYGDGSTASPLSQDIIFEGGGGYWNIDNWNEFYWSSPSQSTPAQKITGTGFNVSVTFFTSMTYEQEHTLYGATVHYLPRRQIR